MTADALAGWLTSRRWYAGRGRRLRTVRASPQAELPNGLRHVVLEAVYADGAERYQTLVRSGAAPDGDAAGHYLGRIGRAHAYDALAEPHRLADLPGLLFGSPPGPSTGSSTGSPPGPLPGGLPGRALGGEQSNTTVVFGERLAVKFFRRVQPGVNPDIELSQALTRLGCADVPALLGAADAVVDGRAVSVAMATEYLPGSADGWAYVTAPGSPAGPAAGADAFAADAAALGRALGRVHAALATAFGTRPEPASARRMTARLTGRLERALTAAEPLRPYARRLRDGIAAGVPAGGPPAQRVHGDLHLGQVLRTASGWRILDFEGEPGRPVAERRQADSPLRDVAAMLRSLDYAAAFVSGFAAAGPTAAGPADRFEEWSAGAAAALCRGYAEVTGVDPLAHPRTLAAYLLDKLAYEVAYEARHRPAWLPVPMRALERMFGPA